MAKGEEREKDEGRKTRRKNRVGMYGNKKTDSERGRS